MLSCCTVSKLIFEDVPVQVLFANELDRLEDSRRSWHL